MSRILLIFLIVSSQGQEIGIMPLFCEMNVNFNFKDDFEICLLLLFKI